MIKKKKIVTLIINEQHTIFPEQRELLEKRFGEYETMLVPASGWDLAKIEFLIDELPKENELIFASPIPAMMKLASEKGVKWFVFHNDKREKQETEAGKVFLRISPTGWQLV